MLRTLIALVVLLVAVPAVAQAGDHRTQVARGAVTIDGTVRWRGQAVTSPLVWSERGDAVAFTAQDRQGHSRLVIVVVEAGGEATALSWPMPSAVGPARSVTWLGAGRVGAGPSELDPRVVASYTIE